MVVRCLRSHNQPKSRPLNRARGAARPRRHRSTVQAATTSPPRRAIAGCACNARRPACRSRRRGRERCWPGRSRPLPRSTRHPALHDILPGDACYQQGTKSPVLHPVDAGGTLCAQWLVCSSFEPRWRHPSSPARGTVDGAQRPDNAPCDAKRWKPLTSPACLRGAGSKPDRRRLWADALRGEGAGSACTPAVATRGFARARSA